MNQLLINRITKIKRDVDRVSFEASGEVEGCLFTASLSLEGAIRRLKEIEIAVVNTGQAGINPGIEQTDI